MVRELILDPNMTSSEILKASHSFSAVPALSIMWSFSVIILFCVLWGITDKSKTNITKLFIIFGSYILLSGLVMLFFIFSPNAVQGIASLFS